MVPVGVTSSEPLKSTVSASSPSAAMERVGPLSLPLKGRDAARVDRCALDAEAHDV